MRLIASAPPASNPQLANILPVVLPESISRANNVRHLVVAINLILSSCLVAYYSV
jgi:hypothetical protein